DLRLSGYVEKPCLHAAAAFLFGPEHDTELKLNAPRDKTETLAGAFLLRVLKLRPKLLYRVSDRDVVYHRFPISLPMHKLVAVDAAPSAWARRPGLARR